MSLIFVLKIWFLFGLVMQIKGDTVFFKALRNLHKDPGPHGFTRANVETKWIEQKLDHFDMKENRTWQMVRIMDYN